MADTISYTPPPTLREFIKDYLPGELFYDWIIGPLGSGKTTGIFFKLIYMAGLQEPGSDGIRRSRAVVVRNTMPQLKDTTLSSWHYWFKDGQAGKWYATAPKANTFVLRYNDVECEVLFRALDTPDDVARVLSLEVTFAILDEYVEIPRPIVDALAGRCGRYPPANDGGATNWGMWGSSNPGTEDNWWFDHLHDSAVTVQPGEDYVDNDTRNTRYFLQPSGFSPEAENIENLPGKAAYYTNQAKGKTDTWINQFLKAEWGFSVAGKPVIGSFKADLHTTRQGVHYNPHLPLVAGFDPGVGGSAMVFGQEDLHGRLLVLGELIAEGMGASRFVQELLRPYLKRRFPGIDLSTGFVIAPDPAANNRATSDEKTVVDVLRRHFRVSIESNNQLALRLDAIENYTTRLTPAGPALVIDEKECPTVVRALKGGWRYALDAREHIRGSSPEKNAFSHPGDATGYLARYFHRQAGRNERYSRAAGASRPARSAYHFT